MHLLIVPGRPNSAPGSTVVKTNIPSIILAIVFYRRGHRRGRRGRLWLLRHPGACSSTVHCAEAFPGFVTTVGCNRRRSAGRLLIGPPSSLRSSSSSLAPLPPGAAPLPPSTPPPFGNFLRVNRRSFVPILPDRERLRNRGF